MITLAAATYLLWDLPAALPFVLAAAVVVTAAVWWLYPRQVRMISLPWRWILPAARTAALLAIVVALLQPVVVRPKTASEQGGVLVLVDQSESMTVSDIGRTPAERVALADGLGVLPAGKRDDTADVLTAELAQLDALVDAVFRARNELEYATLAGRNTEEPRNRLEQDIRRLTLHAADLSSRAPALPRTAGLLERFGELTEPPVTNDEAGLKEMRARIDRARQACANFRAQADAALYTADGSVKATCDALAARSRSELVNMGAARVQGLFPGAAITSFGFSADIAPLAEGRAADTGSTAVSDLTGALIAAAARARDRSLQAVLLFSDGRQIGGGTSAAALPTGAPLFAVSAAEPVPRDLSVVDLNIPSGRFVGETVTVHARLRGTGMKNLPAEVRLEVDGAVRSQRVTFTEPEITASFPLTLRAGGFRQIEVSLAPIEGEISNRNNLATRWIKVFSHPARAAVVVGPDPWAAASLRRALEHYPGFDISFQQLASRGDRVTLPVADIAEQDVIVLCDVGVENLSRPQRIALYRYVTDRGGRLILVAGADHVPRGFASIPMTAEFLPYEPSAPATWRIWPGETPALRLVPSRQSLAHPALRLDDDLERSTARWHGLSGVFRYMPLLELKPDAVPLLVERASGVAAATEMPLGAGRVIYIGTNETWRWGGSGAEGAYERFWRQLLRYSAGQPYAVTGHGLSLDAEPIAAAPQQRITVRGRLRDDNQTIVQGLELAVLRDGQRIREVSLLPDGDPAAGRFQTTLNGIAAGWYELRLQHPADSSRWIGLPLRVEQSSEAELADLSGDERALRRLAEPTGGGVIALSELPSLPGLVASARDQREQVVQYALWDSPYLFSFVLACLGMEWALRKRFGLA
jgi:hypothetical protein